MEALLAPDALRDERPGHMQPWASRANKERLVRMALEPVYLPEQMNLVSAANPGVAAGLLQDVNNAVGSSEANLDAAWVDETMPVDVDGTGEEPNAKRRKRSAVVELALCILLRNQTMHIMPFLLTCLTVMLFKTGVSDDCWRVLTYFGMCFARDWAEDFCNMVDAHTRRDPEGTHEGVKFAVIDNCSYKEHHVYEGPNRDGGLLHTVNWLRVPLDTARFAGNVHRGSWHNGSRRFKVRRFFSPSNPRPGRFKATTWLAFMALAMAAVPGGVANQCGDILRRPTGPPPEQSRIIYEDPVLDVGTAAFADIDLVTQIVYTYYFHTMSPASMVLMVGDQQTYERLFWQKKYHQQRYDWLLPLPGEFHFVVHTLMAIHKLWYRSLSQHVIHGLGWHKTVKEEWTSVEEWHHYDRFYQLLIYGLTAYLVAVVRVPRHLLLSPLQLMDRVKDNATGTLIVRFLFDFGYPYLRLRNAIRCNDHEVIDLMWIITHLWFRATGKNKYAIMSIYVTAFRHAMVLPLVLIWTLMRTASLCGYVCANVAWDFVLERQNRDFKQFVKHAGRYLRERLRKAPAMLNAFRHIWPRFLAAIGRVDGDVVDKCNISSADRIAMVDHLIKTLPASFNSLCATSQRNLFKVVAARLNNPWDVVANVWTDGRTAAAGDDSDDSDGSDGSDSSDDNSDGYDSAANDPRSESDAPGFKYVTTYLRKMMRR